MDRATNNFTTASAVIKGEPTVRQRFDAIVDTLQQEATDAARALGFKETSRDGMMAAVNAELDMWYRQGFSLPDDWKAATRVWPRACCLLAINDLLDVWHFLDGWIDIGRTLDELDVELQTLREHLASAAAVHLA